MLALWAPVWAPFFECAVWGGFRACMTLRLGLCRLLVGSCGPRPGWVNCWAVAVLRGKFQYLRSASLCVPCRAPLGFRVVCGLRCSLWAPMGSNILEIKKKRKWSPPVPYLLSAVQSTSLELERIVS